MLIVAELAVADQKSAGIGSLMVTHPMVDHKDRVVVAVAVVVVAVVAVVV